MLSLLLGFGIPIAVKSGCARAPEQRDAILRASLRFAAWLPIPAVLAGVLLTFGPLRGISPSAQVCALVLFTLTPLAVVRNCLHARLIGEGALGPVAAMRFTPLAIAAAAAVALFAIGRLNLITAVALVQLTVIVEIIVLRRSVVMASTESAPLIPLARFGAKALVGQLAETSNLRLDQAILVLIVPSAALGQYAVAASVALLPAVISQAVGARFFAVIGSTSDHMKAGQIERAMRLTCLVTIVTAAGLGIGSQLAVPFLFGKDFGDVARLTLILLPGTVFFASAYMAATALVAIGRPVASTLTQLTGSLVTVLGIFPAARVWGVFGAAILSDITYIAAFFAAAILLRRSGVGRLTPRSAEVVEITRMLRRAGHAVKSYRPASAAP